jgi:hypothetical protein
MIMEDINQHLLRISMATFLFALCDVVAPRSSLNRGNTTSTQIHSSNASTVVTTNTTAIARRLAIMTALTGGMQGNTALCVAFLRQHMICILTCHCDIGFRQQRNRFYSDYMLHTYNPFISLKVLHLSIFKQRTATSL